MAQVALADITFDGQRTELCGAPGSYRACSAALDIRDFGGSRAVEVMIISITTSISDILLLLGLAFCVLSRSGVCFSIFQVLPRFEVRGP